jgi:transcription initiation factor TFIIIB Brf1 subunit/transcription initiation factor TFIIB
MAEAMENSSEEEMMFASDLEIEEEVTMTAAELLSRLEKVQRVVELVS